MGTKKDPGKFDCYANAEPDEPMFILLGRDPMAGALVREWARWREATGEDPAKVAEARATAVMMDARAMARGRAPVDHALEYVSIEDYAQALFRGMSLSKDTLSTLDLSGKKALVRGVLQRAWNLGRMGVTGFEDESIRSGEEEEK